MTAASIKANGTSQADVTVSRSVYAATIPAAFFHNHQLIAFYRRLVAAGKPPKLALIACARKLVIYANTVLARGTPWAKQNAPA